MEPLSIIRNSEVGKRCLIANARANIDLSRTVKHHEVEREYQIRHWSLAQRWYRQRLNRLLAKRDELEKGRLRREKEEWEAAVHREQQRQNASGSRRVTFANPPAVPRYGTPRAGDPPRQYRARSAPPRSDFASSSSRAHYAFRPTETAAQPRPPSGSRASAGSRPAAGKKGRGSRTPETPTKPPQFTVVWT